MTAKKKLEALLAEKQITFTLPEGTPHDTFLPICQILSRVSLLNIENLKTLINIADQTDKSRLHNLSALMPKISGRLDKDLRKIVTQDTFDAFCHLANINALSLVSLANCFGAMADKVLLSPTNIKNLVQRIEQEPTNRVTPFVQQLSNWLGLNESWINQEYFDFIMRNYGNITSLLYSIDKIHQENWPSELCTIANCQAILDCYPLTLHIFKTREEFNQMLLECCNAMVTQFATTHLCHVKTELLNNLDKRFKNIIKLPEVQKDPREFLHLLAVIDKAIPAPGYTPPNGNVEELIALANKAQGHPSPAWQALGLNLTLLGIAIAAALGFTLIGVVTALVGVGLFAYSRTRHGLSKDLMTLAQQNPFLKS